MTAEAIKIYSGSSALMSAPVNYCPGAHDPRRRAQFLPHFSYRADDTFYLARAGSTTDDTFHMHSVFSSPLKWQYMLSDLPDKLQLI